MNIGVFGSAFDPPTKGHLDVLRQAATLFDTILLVPSAAHPFCKRSLSFDLRLQLLNAFVEDAGRLGPALEISPIEAELLCASVDRPVYTYDVLTALSDSYPQAKLTFIRGPDNAQESVWQRFYRYRDIERQWSIFTAEENCLVRSSHLRALLGTVNTIAGAAQISRLLTPAVHNLIVTLSLYQRTKPI